MTEGKKRLSEEGEAKKEKAQELELAAAREHAAKSQCSNSTLRNWRAFRERNKSLKTTRKSWKLFKQLRGTTSRLRTGSWNLKVAWEEGKRQLKTWLVARRSYSKISRIHKQLEEANVEENKAGGRAA